MESHAHLYLSLPCIRLRQQHQDHTITPQEHLADEPIPIHRLSPLAIAVPRHLRPHLLDILQHHVAMPVECFHTREKLAVVAGADEDLGVLAHGGLE